MTNSPYKTSIFLPLRTWVDHRTHLILSYVKNCRGLILHIGCADPECDMASEDWLHGHIALEAPKRVVGLDIDSPRFREMKKAGYKVRQSVRRRFDLIIAGEVLEHVPNQGDFLKSIAAKLQPGGKIILTTPNPFGITHALWFWLSGGQEHHGQEHVLWQSPATMRNLCQDIGLRINKVLFCSYGFKRRKWYWLFLWILETWPWCRQTIIYEIIHDESPIPVP